MLIIYDYYNLIGSNEYGFKERKNQRKFRNIFNDVKTKYKNTFYLLVTPDSKLEIYDKNNTLLDTYNINLNYYIDQ